MAASTQQIAFDPNKYCTVEPCGSTDRLWKTPVSGPVDTSLARHGLLYQVSAVAVLICFLKGTMGDI